MPFQHIFLFCDNHQVLETGESGTVLLKEKEEKDLNTITSGSGKDSLFPGCASSWNKIWNLYKLRLGNTQTSLVTHSCHKISNY